MIHKINNNNTSTETLFYNKNGKITEEEKGCYAKKRVVTVEKDNQTETINNCSIKCNQMRDLWDKNMDSFKEAKFTKVSEKAFDFYIRYLETGNDAYLSNANGEIGV